MFLAVRLFERPVLQRGTRASRINAMKMTIVTYGPIFISAGSLVVSVLSYRRAGRSDTKNLRRELQLDLASAHRFDRLDINRVRLYNADASRTIRYSKAAQEHNRKRVCASVGPAESHTIPLQGAGEVVVCFESVPDCAAAYRFSASSSAETPEPRWIYGERRVRRSLGRLRGHGTEAGKSC